MSKGGSAMSGRDILDTLNNSDSFYLNALAFEDAIENGKCFVLDTPDLALEFLSFYVVLETTKEADYLWHDLSKLSKTYDHINLILRTKNKIASTDFLSCQSPEKFYFVLRDNTCFRII